MVEQNDSVLAGNRLLAAMPEVVRDRLRGLLEIVPMPLGKVLYESGVAMAHVYFPIRGCIVSMLYVMEDGASAEIAVVGNEGILGISLFMGGETTPSRAVVQSAGQCYRLKAQLLKDEFGRLQLRNSLFQQTSRKSTTQD